MEVPIGADERAFREHVERPDFVIGEARGRWRLLRVAWPTADVAVTARDGTGWGFRFLLDGYPAALPNARPCDVSTGAPLTPDLWPRGEGRFAAVFAPGWNPSALYLPCDRLALPGHDQWRTQLPHLLWRPAVGIVHYLEILHELLASRAHHPAVRSAA